MATIHITGGRIIDPVTTVTLTLVDGETGEVLWHDEEAKKGSYDRRKIEALMASVIEKLP